MVLRQATNWQRGGLVSLLLVLGLTVAIADSGRSADDTKKPAAKADEKAKPADASKSDEKAKSDDKKDEKPADKPEVKPVTVGPPSGGHPATDLINKELAKFWAANSVRPSAKATDYEFCRRVYLDIIGRIPAAWEVKQYVADTESKGRRARLINKLLNDSYYKEEFDKYWSDMWKTLLLTRSGNPIYHEQMEDWLEEQFSKNRPYDEMVRELLTATGKTDQNGAVNFILAHLGEPQRDRGEEGQFDAVPITSRAVRLFLGLRIQCTQCHNHPFNPDWKQSHFWGVNAFFRQVERDGQPTMANQRNQMAAQLTLKENDGYNSKQTVYYEDRQAVVKATGPKFLDGKTIPSNVKKSRREVLADFIIEHEDFTKEMVNRMWGHFFGRGLCQQPSVDDFGEHNPVIHPEILDGLARQFKDYKYNIKELISWICNSEAYALSSTANSTNAKPDQEPYFSRMLLKNMSPEQLYDSLKTALDQPLQIKKAPANPGKKPNGQPVRTVDEARKKARDAWLAKLTKNFGDDEGNEITFNGTVVQALLLMNGKELQSELSRKDNNTIINAAAKGKDPRGIIDELFLAALGRKATPNEAHKLMKSGLFANNMPYYEDVFWALLNCDEFVLNH
jgi:hypothetical protein